MSYRFERPEKLLVIMFIFSSFFENQVCCNEEKCLEISARVVLRLVVKSMLLAN